MFILEKDLCIQCGACVDICHQKSLELTDGELLHHTEKCNWCGHCLAVCPRDAIMIDGEGYNVEDVEEFNLLTKPTAKQIRRQIMMRRSVRKFTEEAVTEEELSYILEAAKYAPTARNAQDNMLLVVTNPDEIAALRDKSMEIIASLADKFQEKVPGLSAFFRMRYQAYKNGEDVLFYDAPAVIYVFSDNDLDGAICASTMMQMIGAQSDLGACYVQLASDPFNNSEKLKEEYQIPANKKCVIAIVLGHTDIEFLSSVQRKEIPIIRK